MSWLTLTASIAAGCVLADFLRRIVEIAAEPLMWRLRDWRDGYRRWPWSDRAPK